MMPAGVKIARAEASTNTVVRLHKLHPEAAQVNRLAVLYHLSLDGAQHVVLLQLVLNQPDVSFVPYTGAGTSFST